MLLGEAERLKELGTDLQLPTNDLEYRQLPLAGQSEDCRYRQSEDCRYRQSEDCRYRQSEGCSSRQQPAYQRSAAQGIRQRLMLNSRIQGSVLSYLGLLYNMIGEYIM